MVIQKNLGILVISMFVLHVTCVMASEQRVLGGDTLSTCHKQRATKLIIEAQTVHKKAELDSEHLCAWISSQPVGIAMSSMHRSASRLAGLGAAAIKVNKFNRIKKTADQAITVCRGWHDSTDEDAQIGAYCHQAIEDLRKLQQ